MATIGIEEALRSAGRPTLGETSLGRVLAALPALSPEGPWLAGGALRRTLLGHGTRHADFDLFFRDAAQFDAGVAGLVARGLEVRRETPHLVEARGRLPGFRAFVEVQCIRFAFHPDAASLVDSFDFTISQFAFDGETLTVGPQTMADLADRRLAVHRVTYPASTLLRTRKYARQGFKASRETMEEIARMAEGTDVLFYVESAEENWPCGLAA